MNKIIAIVGMCGSGKSVAVDFFLKHDYQKVYFGGITLEKMKEEKMEITPENEKIMRESLREKYGMGAYATLSLPKIKKLILNGNVVIDGLYSWEELKILKGEFGEQLVVVSVVTNKNTRYERIGKRDIRPLTKEQAKNRDIAEIENMAKGGPIAYADYFILNNGTVAKMEKSLEDILNNL